MLEHNSYFINEILKKYLAPTIVVLLEVSSIAFYNTLIVGRMLGSDGLAVMSLTSSFTFLYYMFGCLINIGAAIAASVALGQNDLTKVGKLEGFAFAASIVIPALISGVLLFLLHPVMTFLGADDSLFELSKTYVCITLTLGFVHTLMYFPFNFLRVDGRSKIATGVFALMAVLDFVSVYAVLQLGLGLAGVGVATMLSALFADVVGVFVLFFGKGRQIVPVKVSLFEVFPLAKEVFQLGSSSGLNNLWNMLRTMVLNKMVVVAFGTGGLAAFGVACSVINLTNATTLGVGQTTAPLVGVFYGERDKKSILMLIRSSAKVSVLIHLVIFVGLFAFAPYVAASFGITQALMADAVWLIRWTALGFISAGMVNVYIQAYATVKHVILSNILAFLRSFGLVVCFAVLLLNSPAPKFYIVAFLLGDVCTIAMMYLISGGCNKKRGRTTGVLMLDKSMDDGVYLSFSVSADKEGAARAAEKIEAFCEENDFSPKLSMGIPLAVEEIVSVMSERCLLNHPEKYSDVRIFKSGEDVLIRVRCGGEYFDPVEWYRKKLTVLSQEEWLDDPSMGIKLINDMSKEIRFSRTFGVNNLVAVL